MPMFHDFIIEKHCELVERCTLIRGWQSGVLRHGVNLISLLFIFKCFLVNECWSFSSWHNRERIIMIRGFTYSEVQETKCFSQECFFSKCNDLIEILCIEYLGFEKKNNKKQNKTKTGAWVLVLQLKMSFWPCNKSHGVVMCLLITVRCIAVIHTLIYSPGPLHTPKHTEPFLLYHSPPPLHHLSASVINCRQNVCINPYMYNPQHVLKIIHSTVFCLKKPL